MMFRLLLIGIVTMLPGFGSRRGSGGGNSQSARYCYSVWLRHLALAHAHGLDKMPERVAELGPGNSLGVGICALLSGVNHCWAFDVEEHADLTTNLEIFEELVALFQSRAPIPDDKEFPHVKPYLDDYSFPHSILTDEVLERALTPERQEAIRASLQNTVNPDSLIQYKVPWFDADIVETGGVDMIYSQAVLEHVDELESTYAAMHRWLREGGLMSHQIDFRCHGTAEQWNGHWRYADWLWRVIRGGRGHLINRMPYSEHRRLLAENGFQLLAEKKVHTPSVYTREQLAKRFRNMAADDLETSGAFLQSAK